MKLTKGKIAKLYNKKNQTTKLLECKSIGKIRAMFLPFFQLNFINFIFRYQYLDFKYIIYIFSFA